MKILARSLTFDLEKLHGSMICFQLVRFVRTLTFLPTKYCAMHQWPLRRAAPQQ